jgi:hypothetical protein
LRVSSGNCTVVGGRNRLRIVINIPLAMPIPYTVFAPLVLAPVSLKPSRFYNPQFSTFNDL